MRYSTAKRKNDLIRRLAIVGVIVIAALTGSIAGAQAPADTLTARSVFRTLQTPALEILRESARLDMLDYWDADSVYDVANAVGGTSHIVALTPDYMKISVTPVSVCEIKILPGKKQRTIMEIYTVGDSVQAADSDVRFYDTALRPLDTKRYLETPDLKYFFDIPKGSATSMKEIREMIPFPTVEYSASSDDDILRARLTVGEYMNVDDYNIMRLFLKPEIAMEWKGKYRPSK